MSWIYGCVVHCYKEDIRNKTLEDQITVVMLSNVHPMYFCDIIICNLCFMLFILKHGDILLNIFLF